jgi:hypothetical protein
MRCAARISFKLLASALALEIVAACSGSNAPTSPSGATTPAPPLQLQPPPSSLPSPTPPLPDALHGHFRGAAAVDGPEFSHYVEGLLTVDGEVRLHMGGPGLGGGVLSGAGIPITVLPVEALQFVGHVNWSGDVGNGSGVVVGESCVRPASGRWCGVAVPAEIALSGSGSDLKGELRVDTAEGDESWPIALTAWSSVYESSATHESASAIVTERFAPFARSEPVIVNIDGGRLFFQSPSSGCTGNGELTLHSDGRFHLFDVVLTIENCTTTYADFNGRFEGLATATQGGYWDYDRWFVMLLSTPAGAPRSALMMLAHWF